MLALLAFAVCAQSSITLQVGKDKQDSIARARSDSAAYRREQRRDSLRAHRQFRDSVQQQARIRRQIPVTPAVLATAFKDAPARDLLLRARAARLSQDSALTGYDASSYERMVVGMGFQRIELRELRIRPRQPKWNVGVGSLWFDASTAHLVRAVYRMAQEMDIFAVAKQESQDEHHPDDDIPVWLKPMITPMRANVSAVTVEYGLHEGRFWLPRAQTIEGEAQVSFMHIPFKLEQRYTYSSVNSGEPMAEVVVAALDTARDSASRATRIEHRRTECAQGTQRVRVQHRSEENMRILVRGPCATVELAHSAAL